MATQPEATKAALTATRGPSYPFITLQEAIARAQKLYDEDGRAPAAASEAVKHWGYSEKSSGGRQTISALLQYGLIRDDGSGDQRRVSLTKRALDILLLEKDAEERREAIKIAANSPKLFAEVLNRYASTGLPSNGSLKHYLISERELAPGAADNFVKTFRANIDYTKLHGSASASGAKVPDVTEPGDAGEAKPEVGDLIQWEANGVLQFEAPRRVRALQEHEGTSWVFVEGSPTGVPLEETTVVETRQAKPPSPPPLLPEKDVSVFPTEREWLRGPLSRDSSYRLIITGELGPREIGKLIRLLEAQKNVLSDDDENVQ